MIPLTSYGTILEHMQGKSTTHIELQHSIH